MSEVEVPLSSVKHGDKGSVRVRLVFTPRIIAKSRRETTTFSQAGRAMSTVGSVPLGVGKGVGKGVLYGGKGLIHGVGTTVGFAGRKAGLIKKKDKHGNEVLVEESTGQIVEGNGADLGYASSDGETRPIQNSTMAQTLNAGQMSGIEEHADVQGGHAEAISITCLSGSNLVGTGNHDVKPYVQLTLGRKSYKTSHAKRAVDPEWRVLVFKAGLSDPVRPES